MKTWPRPSRASASPAALTPACAISWGWWVVAWSATTFFQRKARTGRPTSWVRVVSHGASVLVQVWQPASRQRGAARRNGVMRSDRFEEREEVVDLLGEIRG